MVWNLPQLGKARYGAMQYGTQFTDTGSVASEYFIVDGVQYLSLCEGYKSPTRERKPLISWQKIKRPLKIAAAALAIAAVSALVVWGVAKLLQNKGGDDDTSIENDVSQTELVSDTIHSEAISSESPIIESTQPKQEEVTTTTPWQEDPKSVEKKETIEKPKETTKETPKVVEPPNPKDTLYREPPVNMEATHGGL